MKIYQLPERLITEPQAIKIIGIESLSEDELKEYFEIVSSKTYKLSQYELLYMIGNSFYNKNDLLKYVRDDLSNKNVWYVDITDVYEALHYLETFEAKKITTYIYKDEKLYKESELEFDRKKAKKYSDDFTNEKLLCKYIDTILLPDNQDATIKKLQDLFKLYKEVVYDNLISKINMYLTKNKVTCQICENPVKYYNDGFAMADYIKNEFIWCDNCHEPRKSYFIGLSSLTYMILKDEMSDITHKLKVIENGLSYTKDYIFSDKTK